MKVYTFRTSPTNDGIYLQGLSSTIVILLILSLMKLILIGSLVLFS